jgi:predicted nuclease of predicted toxin-antitoxin system
MKLLVDMNLSPRWVDVFAGAGIHAVHWSTVGAKDASDAEIMAHALTIDTTRERLRLLPLPGRR